jgi:hypothetical protein
MNEKPKKDLTKELAQELDVFDDMFSALIELLQEKKIITRKEFEAKLKAKIEKAKGKESYRDIQFAK